MAEYSWRQVPIIGNDIYQVGQVIDIWSQPCGPNPWIAVGGFFTYLPQFLWSFIKPEPTDLLIERAGRPHKRKRKRRFIIDEIDVVGKGRDAGFRRVMMQGVKLLERVGFYLVVADATSDLLINWTSLAYTWSGCNVPGSDIAQAYGEYGFFSQTIGDLTSTIPGTTGWDQGNAYAATTQVSLFGVGPKQFGGSAKLRLEQFVGPKGTIKSVECVVSYVGGGTQVISADHPGTKDGSGEWVFIERNWIETLGPCSARLYVTYNGGRLFSEGMTLSAMGAPYGGLDADP